MYRELAPHGKVHLPNRETAQQVARSVAELQSRFFCRGWLSEGIEVDQAAAGSRWISDVDRLAGHKIRSKLFIHPCRIDECSTTDVERKRRSSGDASVQRPMSEQSVSKSVVIFARKVIR